MNFDNKHKRSSKVKGALFQTLLRRIPPKQASSHLEDVVDALMDSLFEGEVDILMNKFSAPPNLRCKGWPEAHLEALKASGWLDGDTSPMVLIENQLSWRRWHEEMEEVIKNLKVRAKNTKLLVASISPKTDPINLQGLNTEQKLAVEAIIHQGVLLLSGGPGTGKTSTVVKILQRALEIKPTLKVGLAAPTGKAAARLQASVQKGIQKIQTLPSQSLSEIPCSTLHRWLGASHGSYKKNKNNPLNLDLLVVDEMSMVDIALMKALLEALPHQSQLVLVGDPNQLPPINSGAIWHRLQKNDTRIYFDEGAIHLKKTYRNRGDLASLSNLLCQKELYSFWDKLFKTSKTANIKAHQCKERLIPNLLTTQLRDHLRDLEELTQQLLKILPENLSPSSTTDITIGAEAELILSSIENLMVLCPKKLGFWGVDEVHKSFLGPSFKDNMTDWPQGTPVMCSENQSELGLANGDIGIVIGEGNQRRLLFRVLTESQKLVTRLINPARLKAIEPALAITIHKAQGSEADEVIVLWPEEISEATKENKLSTKQDLYDKRMLYTAITRARDSVDIFIPSVQVRNNPVISKLNG